MSLPMTAAECTFRDPQGRLDSSGPRILREVYPQDAAQVLAWLQSPLAQAWMRQRRLIATTVLESTPGEPLLLEHERVWFPTYPWEWPRGAWVEAATLTLDLCEEGLRHDLILKDASPLNVLFSGSQPIFVDVLSFAPRDPTSPLWMAYAQFVRTFLLPLCAHSTLGWPLSATQQRRDGYEPADLAPFLSIARKWRRPFRALVTLPLLLEKRTRLLAHEQKVSKEISRYAVGRLLQSARKLLRGIDLAAHPTRWSGYVASALHYTASDHQLKQEFVRDALLRINPARVLDVGANSGVYSRIAAEAGAAVVAWDADPGAGNDNWLEARRAGLSILPLVADFSRPTPALGWGNRECASLLDRAKGQFDCVLMLGILHHLLVADQIPLPAVLDQLWRFSNGWAILEWIPQDDEQFESLCRGRRALYRSLSEEYFLHNLALQSTVKGHLHLANGRSLWLVKRLP